ncbi:hypothetical protein AVEN_232016-1 [Araneus ventricosus]|uniref:Uncharacterized protein n=1 Tax=Araneus ventricosus TaxID=182803 RepID=A0A4Y2L6H9_ARAVE|nr:hypothetical protein AVEN_232016-1 [Araneus ventricosus]
MRPVGRRGEAGAFDRGSSHQGVKNRLVWAPSEGRVNFPPPPTFDFWSLAGKGKEPRKNAKSVLKLEGNSEWNSSREDVVF